MWWKKNRSFLRHRLLAPSVWRQVWSRDKKQRKKDWRNLRKDISEAVDNVATRALHISEKWSQKKSKKRNTRPEMLMEKCAKSTSISNFTLSLSLSPRYWFYCGFRLLLILVFVSSNNVWFVFVWFGFVFCFFWLFIAIGALIETLGGKSSVSTATIMQMTKEWKRVLVDCNCSNPESRQINKQMEVVDTRSTYDHENWK